MDNFINYGMIEQSGSGVLTGSGATEYIFKGLRGTGEAAFAELKNAAISGERFRGKYILFGNCKLAADESFDTLFVATAVNPGAAPKVEKSIGETSSNLSITHIEKPIEMHWNYRTRWNNDLFWACEATQAKLESPEPPSTPSWYEDATDTDIPAADQLIFRWGKSQPPDQSLTVGGVSRTFRWLLLHPRSKPGVEVFPYDAPTVTERTYYRDYASAEYGLARSNAHAAPKKSYIYGRDPRNWISQPQGVEEQGGFFVAVNVFLYADDWDIDIYGE